MSQSAWPRIIPQLYPELSPEEYTQFLDDKEFERVKGLRQILILPFFDEKSTFEERVFAIGFQKLMIRDIRLHPELSVLGPEDSAMLALSEVDTNLLRFANKILIGGALGLGPNRFTCKIALGKKGLAKPVLIDCNNLDDFTLQCRHGILSLLGLEEDELLASRCKKGRPQQPYDIFALGQLQLESTKYVTQEDIDEVKAHFKETCYFTLPASIIEDELSDFDLVKAYYHDEYDVQLLCTLARTLSKGDEPDLIALQFLRKAIELAPGFGKAYMFVITFAPQDPGLEKHAFLAQHLLPSNSFAISRYLGYMIRHELPLPDEHLIYRAIELDPENSATYWQGINLFATLDRPRKALELAYQLKKLLTPPLSERTIYCLRVTPAGAADFDKG
ncbi:MAG TPA: hypothetical protein VK970_05315, partial [Candidatus Methylacidiphilales bacterium]|nr:hypothetical protein [Candidatus Methylacidiphilales bacterium]